MYDEQVEWLIYHPPKSVSFGHQTRVRDPRKAWVATQEFLNEFSVYQLGNSIGLTVYGLEKSIDGAVVQERLDTARELFGPEDSDPHYHQGWELPVSSFERAIEFVLDDDLHPKQTLGPSSMHFYYRFLWREFWQPEEGGQDFDNFGGSDNCFCNMGVSIGGQRVFVQPTMVFPGNWQSARIRFFLDQIELKAPFRFRNQYFKRSLVPVKKKRYGRGRILKLDKSWRMHSAS